MREADRILSWIFRCLFDSLTGVSCVCESTHDPLKRTTYARDVWFVCVCVCVCVCVLWYIWCTPRREDTTCVCYFTNVPDYICLCAYMICSCEHMIRPSIHVSSPEEGMPRVCATPQMCPATFVFVHTWSVLVYLRFVCVYMCHSRKSGVHVCVSLHKCARRREVGGWGRVPFSRNLMSPTPRRKWYLTTGRRFH